MKCTIVLRSTGMCVLLVLFACTGQGNDKVAEAKTSNNMKRIGLAYNEYLQAKQGSAPQKLEDIAPFFEQEELKAGLASLKSGDLVFRYGIGVQDFLEYGSANIVLVYEKDVPTKGGLVGFADVSIKKLTADEYKKALNPKKL